MESIFDPQWLAREMEARSLRTGQLAAESGISRSQIQRIRNGKPPRFDTLRSLKTALDKFPETEKAA